MRYQACLCLAPLQRARAAVNMQPVPTWAISARMMASIPSAKAAHQLTAQATSDAGVALALDPTPHRGRWPPPRCGWGPTTIFSVPTPGMRSDVAIPSSLMRMAAHIATRIAQFTSICTALMWKSQWKKRSIADIASQVMRMSQLAGAAVAESAPAAAWLMGNPHRFFLNDAVIATKTGI